MQIPTYTLNDGHSIPAVGLGTYELSGADGTEAVVAALGSGYRLLDTAVNYENEEAVGEAIRRSDVDRADIIVTTKVPGRHHGYTETMTSFEESRQRLGVDYIDLYLIHWPNPRVDRYLDSWKAMVELRERELVRSIGVSNFTQEHLERVTGETGVTPAVNQIELHPYFPQDGLRAFHAAHGIRTESWSPLGKRSELLSEDVVVSLAEKYGVTPTQLVVRWHVELGAVPIPKSAHASRQRENADVFGFSLDEDDVHALSDLERGRLGGAEPETHEEF